MAHYRNTVRRTYSFADVTACGIPVTVKFHVQPAEPDVGIRRAYVDEYEIVAINGRKTTGKNAKWLYGKIDRTPGEHGRIMQACEESEQEEED